MKLLHLDFETRSTADIRNCGAYVYAQHPDTEITCVSWALGDEEPRLWYPDWSPVNGDDLSDLFEKAERDDVMIAAFNAEFERLMWNHKLVEHGAPPMPIEKFYCVAIQAYSMSYGRTLEQVALQTRVTEKKDVEGRKIMLKTCKPHGFDDDGGPLYHESSVDYAKLGKYCKQDVRTERAVHKRLAPMRPVDLELYHVDQHINAKGFPVDLELAHAAVELVEAEKSHAKTKIEELTMGLVTSPTQREKLLRWARGLGYDKPTLGKQHISEFLTEAKTRDVDPDLIEALETRREAAKSATDKYQAAIDRSVNGRVHGALLMRGARTGRWTGSGVQPQNIKRGFESPVDQALAIDLIKLRDREGLEMIFGDVVETIGNATRGLICASPGHILVSSDYSAIEARALSVVAGDVPNLTAFNNGECIYRHMGAAIHGLRYDQVGEKSNERQMGKQAELAFGYGMGERTFQAQQKGYGRILDIDFCKFVKNKYRSRHPAIVKFWAQIEADAFRCLRRGVTVEREYYTFSMHDAGMAMTMPDGSKQWYIDAHIENKMKFGEIQPCIVYKGQANYQWVSLETYGGKFTENLIQGITARVQAYAVMQAWYAREGVVAHAHDELLEEILRIKASIEALEHDMNTASQAWAGHWPILAKGGWMRPRYCK